MPFEITSVQKERLPALRLIGKRYTRADCDAGGFGGKHREWREKSLCHELAKLGAPGMENGMHGLMTLRADYLCQSPADDCFAYWIGYLFPLQTPVPDGFSRLDLPESDIGVAWIHGECPDIFGEKPHLASLVKLRENSWGALRSNAGGENTLVFFERYHPARFTPDAQGRFTLDYGFYLA